MRPESVSECGFGWTHQRRLGGRSAQKGRDSRLTCGSVITHRGSGGGGGGESGAARMYVLPINHAIYIFQLETDNIVF